MNLRDHAYAKAPYLRRRGGSGEDRADCAASAEAVLEDGRPASSTRTCSGRAPPAAPASSSARWTSSTSTTSSTCAGYQVMIESTFPSEAGAMLRNLETKGNPWGMPAIGPPGLDRRPDVRGARHRTDRIPDEVEYLFWVGCAGAFEDRASKSTRAVAELLTRPGCRSPSSAERVVYGRPGAAHRQRVPVPDARHSRTSRLLNATSARGRSWRPARTASTRWRTSTRSSAGRTRWSTTPSCSDAPGGGRAADAGGRRRAQGDLPRPVLPRPAQPGLHPAARRAGRGAGPDAPRRCTGARNVVLLRRGRRADVDGGADRQADQRRAGRRGAVVRTPTWSRPPARSAW